MIESASAFSFNARRAMEVLPIDQKFTLDSPRYEWQLINDGEIVVSLREALNRIIHSRKMTIGFEKLPAKLSVMPGGAYVVLYLCAETDRRKLAFVDVFALSHCFLYKVLPALLTAQKPKEGIH